MSGDRVITVEIYARTAEGRTVATERFVNPDPEREFVRVLSDAMSDAGTELVSELVNRGLL